MSQIMPPTDSVAAVWYALLGGKYIVRLTDVNAYPGQRSGDVLNSEGQFIGSASDYIYGGSGFAIHTKPFAGYVPCEQIIFDHERSKEQ